MEASDLLSLLQLTVALIQLKLDHFSNTDIDPSEDQREEYYKLGQLIWTVDHALTETIGSINAINNTGVKERIAYLWREASERAREVDSASEFSGVFYEKYIYWLDPGVAVNRNLVDLKKISLANIKSQLRKLTARHSKMEVKFSRGG